jgi:hypothetical protein
MAFLYERCSLPRDTYLFSMFDEQYALGKLLQVLSCNLPKSIFTIINLQPNIALTLASFYTTQSSLPFILLVTPLYLAWLCSNRKISRFGPSIFYNSLSQYVYVCESYPRTGETTELKSVDELSVGNLIEAVDINGNIIQL